MSDNRTGSIPESLSEWPAFAMRVLAQRATAICDQLAERWGVTLREFGLLSLVAATPGQSQQSIGTQLGIDRTTVVGLVDRLEELGLLERRRHADDRRSYGLHLTTRGRRLLPSMRRAVTALHEDLLAPLDANERQQLVDLMGRLLLPPTDPLE